MKVEITNLNYIGIFLTLRCNLSCDYCINQVVGLDDDLQEVRGSEWLSFFKNNQFDPTVPITFQGGEPTIHKDFYEIVNNVNHPIDLLTNLQFDVDKFMANTTAKLFERDLPYPSIRISLHPRFMDTEKIYHKAKRLHDNGYSLGVFMVDHPENKELIENYRKKCDSDGLVFKTKEFLGHYKGEKFGKYAYDDAYAGSQLAECLCKTTELLCSPSGHIYRCHHDLYNKKGPLASIKDEGVVSNDYLPCKFYGMCNPCDVKVKNNRFQVFGHSSVSIKEINYYE